MLSIFASSNQQAMGIAERKEKQKLEIRKMILDASMKLFIEDGFEKVSLRKIADLIEYSPTTIYLYFRDKNEILYQLCEIGFSKMAAFNAELAEIKNPLVRLHKMGENYLRFGLNYPEYYDLMFIQLAPMETLEKMKCGEWDQGDQTLNYLMQTIQECMDRKLMISGDVKAAAIAIWSLVHGMVALSLRRRWDKLIHEDEVIPSMNKALTWILNSIDQSNT